MNERILTIPNGITLVRAFGIPLFLWSYLGLHNNLLSFLILAIGALTDYLDGKIARALNQTSEFGAKFDPAIDRAYIAATVIALSVRHTLPFWILAILLLRDIWLAFVLLLMRRVGGGVFEVTFLGKAATFNLLYALPMFLLVGNSNIGKFFNSVAWAFTIWGVSLYLLTGIGYTRTGVAILRRGNRFRPEIN